MSWARDVDDLIAYYTERTPGSVVEQRDSCIAWHYRECDVGHGAWQAKQLQVALAELSKRAGVPISYSAGERVLEVRSTRLVTPNYLEVRPPAAGRARPPRVCARTPCPPRRARKRAILAMSAVMRTFHFFTF